VRACWGPATLNGSGGFTDGEFSRRSGRRNAAARRGRRPGTRERSGLLTDHEFSRRSPRRMPPYARPGALAMMETESETLLSPAAQ